VFDFAQKITGVFEDVNLRQFASSTVASQPEIVNSWRQGSQTQPNNCTDHGRCTDSALLLALYSRQQLNKSISVIIRKATTEKN
jgi:hypothetical protein